MANSFKNTISKNNNKYSLIQVALCGQLFENSDDAGYVYPKTSGDVQPSWLPNFEFRSILDSLSVKGLGKGCVCVWLSPGGVCYSVCRRRPLRGDTAAVVVFSPTAADNTQQLIIRLNAMLDYAIDIANEGKTRVDIDDNKINTFWEDMQLYFGNMKVQLPASEGGPQMPLTSEKPYAWKGYDSIEQLAVDLKYFPFQTGMYSFRAICLILNDNYENGMVGGNMVLYPKAVKRVYPIQLPQDKEGVSVRVKDNANYYLEGENFIIEYYKAGYDIKPMQSNLNKNYEIIEEIAVLMQYSKELGIVFRKRIELVVLDDHNNRIDKWSWSIPQTSGNSENGLFLEEGKHIVTICADGYDTKEIEINTDITPQPVKLTPKGFEKEICVLSAWSGNKGDGGKRLTLKGVQTHWMYKKYFFKGSGPSKLYVSKCRPWGWLIMVAIVAAYAGFLCGHLLRPQGSSTSPNNPPSNVIGTAPRNNTSMESVVEANVITEQELEAADKAYLERNAQIWYRDSLKSELYKIFFDSILPNIGNWNNSSVDLLKGINHDKIQEYVKSYEYAKRFSEQRNWDAFNQYKKPLQTAVTNGVVNWKNIPVAGSSRAPQGSAPSSTGRDNING